MKYKIKFMAINAQSVIQLHEEDTDSIEIVSLLNVGMLQALAADTRLEVWIKNLHE